MGLHACPTDCGNGADGGDWRQTCFVSILLVDVYNLSPWV